MRADENAPFLFDENLLAGTSPNRSPVNATPKQADSRSTSANAFPLPAEDLLSPSEIAELLERPCPNQEQEAVITAPIDLPIRVVAGAGSGKTETMAQRVVYLIANQIVAPEDILGLTFTEKAAQELKERIDSRLQFLSRQIEKRKDEKSQKIAQHLRNCASIWDNSFAVNVSTYNAYANQVVKQYGAYLGIPRNVNIIPELSAWQVVHDFISNMPADPLVKATVGSLTSATLKLNDDLSNHLYQVDEAIAELEKLRKEFEFEKTNQTITKVIEGIDQRIWCLRVVEKYQEYKREHNYIDYGDQIAFAARLVRENTMVRKNLARQYQVVLLDEFQDTSAAQLNLFSDIFKGKGVVCVGDPNQAIYSFRGASEISMQDCLEKFEEKPGTGQDFTLNISYRNGVQILEHANRVVLDIPLKAPVAEQIAAQPDLVFSRKLAPRFEIEPEDSEYTKLQKEIAKGYAYDREEFLPQRPGMKVAPLRSAPMCGSGEIKTCFGLTRIDEARQVALALAKHYYQKLAAARQGSSEEKVTFSGAILLRDRKDYQYFVQALAELGVPYEVLISTTLLDNPLVAEIYAILKLLTDVSDGKALQRLLVSCGIGLRDIDLLYRYAKELAQEALSQSEPGAEKNPASVAQRAQAETPVQVEIPVQVESLVDLGNLASSDKPASSDNLAGVEKPAGAQTPVDADKPAEMDHPAGVKNQETSRNLEIYLYDALENLPEIGWKPTGSLSELPGFTAAAYHRLSCLREQLFQLRKHQHEPIDALVERVYTGLNLDLDLAISAQANLHQACYRSFKKLAQSFQQEALNPTLPAFVAWLELSELEGNALKVEVPFKDEGASEDKIGAVQILTCHGAKGLEWDVVAVPKLDRSRKQEIRSKNWSTTYSEFPYSLRADREVLPQLTNVPGYFQLEGIKASEVSKTLTRYKKALQAQDMLEHRRLMYVAFTRARQNLILSGAAYDASGTQRKPQRILLERFPEVADLAQKHSFRADVINDRQKLAQVLASSEDPAAAVSEIEEYVAYRIGTEEPTAVAATQIDQDAKIDSAVKAAAQDKPAAQGKKSQSAGEICYVPKLAELSPEECWQRYQQQQQKNEQLEREGELFADISIHRKYDFFSLQEAASERPESLLKDLPEIGYAAQDPVLSRTPPEVSQLDFWPPLPSIESNGQALYQLASDLVQAQRDEVALAEAAEILHHRSTSENEDPWFSDARALVQVWQERQEQPLYLPKQLAPTTVTRFSDRESYVKNLRRPLPETKVFGAQVGTYFHQWVDQLFRGASPAERADLSKYAPDFTEEFNRDQVETELLPSLESLQQKFLEMQIWESYEYVDSEYRCSGLVPFAGGEVGLQGSIDAIFRHRESGKIWILDWKTDRDLSDQLKLEKYFTQLAQYRFLYAELNALDIAEVEAGLCQIGAQKIIPLPSEQEINTLEEYQELFKQIAAE